MSEPSLHQKSADAVLKIAEGIHADTTCNIDVEDGLTNGASGLVKCLYFRDKNSPRCSIIWVLFDDPNIGGKVRLKYVNLYKN